jgi:SAM-dependent methyltransferase
MSTSDFKGKLVLDCGCGFGRHLYYVAEAEAEFVVGIDLSHAVEAAAHNIDKFSNADVVQASIYALPFRPIFDIAYSIGVIQHTTDPKRALQAIGSLIKPGGILYAWIYGPRPWWYRFIVDNLRLISLKLGDRSLYWLSYLLALGSYGLVALPRRVLNKLGLTKGSLDIPVMRYAEYPFAVSHADWFDRLGAPITAYFSQREAEELLNQVPCTVRKIKFRSGGSWKLFGIKE